MSGPDGCIVHAWCDVDHATDQDEFEAQYHKQTRSGLVTDYWLVHSEGRAYGYWLDNFDVAIDDVQNDTYIDQLMTDLANMKVALAEFGRGLLPLRRSAEVDDRLRELSA